MERNAPVTVAEGSASAKSDGKVKDESLAQLSGDSGDGSDGHLGGSNSKKKEEDNSSAEDGRECDSGCQYGLS